MNVPTAPTRPDEELWRLARRGDRDAFGGIVERYQALICSLAYSACGNVSRSEDLAQDTFLNAWQRLGELREPSKLRAWLCGIVRNLAANAVRREQRRGGAAESIEGIEEPVSLDADPAAQAVTAEEQTLLWRSLAALPVNYREPIVLFYRQGQSVAEVARSLELSEEAVKQRLSRGRAMLREELATVVESTLTRTRPTGAFTAGVLAVLPALAPVTEAAVLAGVATSNGATAAKSLFAAVGKWALLGPAIGLVIGLASTRAAASVARSATERACVIRHSRRIVIFSWLMSIGLVLALLPAGSWYHPSSLGIIAGIFTWVIVLVGTILWLCSRLDREVLRIRVETGTDDESVANVSSNDENSFTSFWPRVPYQSRIRFLGLPLLAVANMGMDATPGKNRRALGWVAIGDTAFSPFLALGGVAVAPIAFGGITIGLASFSFWGAAFGALAFGSIAVGWWSFGLAAVGWEAAAGCVVIAKDYALGVLASAANFNTPAVKEWFLGQWFTTAAQWLFFTTHFLLLVMTLFCLARVFYRVYRVRRRLS